MNAPPGQVLSPCIRNCCLDEQDVCMGCGRTLEEIRDWSAADDTMRARILGLAAERRAQRDARRRAWLASGDPN